jgi:Asp-tRNA(Asn)/Glu-tRNA(Gln) amidotransferase B subunit
MPKDYREKFGEIIPHDTLEILLDYPQLVRKLDEIAELLTGSRPSGPFASDVPSSAIRVPRGERPRADGANSRAAALRNTPYNSSAISLISNLFTSVLLAEEKSAEYLNDLPAGKQLKDLAEMNAKKELSSTATKEVFLRLFDPQMRNKDTRSIAKELGVIQENDLSALEKIVDTVLAKPETQKAQEDFRNGEEKVIGFLVGQVMKESHGKANPSAVQEILRKKLA